MTAQHLLFDDLPETERLRKPARRSRATSVAAPMAVDVVREAVPAPPPASLMSPSLPAMALPAMASLPLVAPAAPAFEPAALTNPELRALVQAIPDLRLSFLLVEAARELRRRVAPDRIDEDADRDEDGPAEPNPALLRAARQVVGELSGDE